jgi:hypothetical protein
MTTPTAPDAPDELGPSRDEAHLYLHLQRVAFCLERQAARRAEPPDAALVARIGHEIEALDAYLDEQFPDRELPIARLLRRFALDDAALRLISAWRAGSRRSPAASSPPPARWWPPRRAT